MPPSPDTIRHILSELLHHPLSAEDAQQIAAVLAALAADTQAMRQLPVEGEEPVLLYEARP